ncbi:MAG: hypothetical protein M1814_004526 [Vezdaea aestivalis]|nr:MAG: hypothetical protein M1814_004526 [Vezdaea aestivalis]
MAATIPPRAYANLARDRLHPRLAQLFARYPSPVLLAAVKSASQPPSADPSRPAQPSSTPQLEASTGADDTISTSPIPLPSSDSKYQSPFYPRWHPITKRFMGPVYSLRRQADLFKLARRQGVDELLPDSKKNPTTRTRLRQERGLRVRGTGEGQRPKGKKWERTMDDRLEKRRKAMENMPRLIETWKTQGHGRYMRKSKRTG